MHTVCVPTRILNLECQQLSVASMHVSKILEVQVPDDQVCMYSVPE